MNPNPIIKMYRNGEESYYFTLEDLIRVIIQCDKSRSLGMTIYDSLDRPRYRGFSHGKNLEFKTRFKYNDAFGTWKAVIVGSNPPFKKVIYFKFISPEEMRLRQLIEDARIRQGKPAIPPKKDNKVPLTRNSGWGKIFVKPKIHVLGLPLLHPAIIPSIPLRRRVKKRIVSRQTEKQKIETIGIPVINLRGIGKTYESRLNKANIFTTAELINYSASQLAEITNAPISKCEEWLIQAKQIQEKPIITETSEKKEEKSIPLVQIKGIGPTYAKRLESAGILSVQDLLVTPPEKIKEYSRASINKVKQWLSQAVEITGSRSENTPIKDYSISRVTKTGKKAKNELIQVKGIGPVTSKRLMEAGITSINKLVFSNIGDIKPFIRGSKEKIAIIIGNAFYALLVNNKQEALDIIEQLLKEKEETDLLLIKEGIIRGDDILELSKKFAEYKLKIFKSIQEGP